MAAHRYWRLFCHKSANASYMGIAEWRLYDLSNTLITGGTASANDVFSSPTYDASTARDGNNATFWSTSASFPQNGWIKLDFGAGITKDVSRIEIQTPASTGYDITPNSFELQYSDDDATWVTQRSFTKTWTVAAMESFDCIPAPDYDTRYWRLFVRASADVTFTGAAEIYFYDQTNVAITGGTETANREFSGTYNAAKARDGNNATYWAGTASRVYGTWFLMDFTTDKSVLRIEIKPVASPDYDQSPSNFAVQSSSDGESWDTIADHPSVTWANDTLRSFAVYTAPAVGGKRRPVIVCG